MNWFKNLFSSTEASEPPPPKKEAPVERVFSPGDLAKRVAKGIPGARVEDFDGTGRDDGILARVTFTHEGTVSRVVLKNYGDGDLVAWLQTRCIGTFGFFALEHKPSDAKAEDDDDNEEPKEARFYLTSDCYVSGPRLRNEVARIRTLPESVQARLIALGKKVDLVKLDEEVLAVVIGDLFELTHIMDDRKKGSPFILSLASEIAFLAKQFPPLAEDVLELAEARTCNYCGASFIFAPRAPSCTACGAPAAAASIMPPSPVGVIPDDPIDGFDPEDPDWQRDKDDRMSDLRIMANALAKIVDSPRIREEPERNRIFVEYKLDGRDFRAKLMEDHVGVRIHAPGVKGDFFLLWSEQDVGGEVDSSAFWHQSERCIFFSKHCRVRSGHGTKEAARLASLPADARARLTDLCEKFETAAELDDEHLAIGLGGAVLDDGVEVILPASRELVSIADAFPRDFDDADPVHFRLSSCTHCGWAYFLELGQIGCSHCGAPSTATA